tara:strand:+ start:45 stop:263 length:219 start_codon:yes stop_codon:yes gene_type:complete
MNLNQRVKSLKVLDIALIKLGVVASTLFILTVWPPIMNWVPMVHWAWFLIVGLILSARPTYRFYFMKVNPEQ